MFPLRPGTQFEYRGTIVEGGASEPHSVVFTVTDLTKMVNGVRTVVAWDQDFLRGDLQEQELAFFAQDDEGNVWNFGEYPEEYQNGKFAGAPSTWIKGTSGAYGGRHMLARPRVGAQYVEGRIPAIDFHDVSRISRTGQATCVPNGCYRRVLVVNEWSPGDPKGGLQIKYYAPGVGLVRVGAHGGTRRSSSACMRCATLAAPHWVKSGQQRWRWTAARTGSARYTGSPSQPPAAIGSAPPQSASQTQPEGISDQLGPITHPCLRQEVLDVRLDRRAGDAEPLRDLRVG
jgi:hypothetical protein